MSSTPTQTCSLCGAVEYVRQDGRGFPPDIAKRRLKKRCAANGCPCDPTYRAGFNFGGHAIGQTSTPTPPTHRRTP